MHDLGFIGGHLQKQLRFKPDPPRQDPDRSVVLDAEAMAGDVSACQNHAFMPSGRPWDHRDFLNQHAS
jgi:hypothetical protein